MSESATGTATNESEQLRYVGPDRNWPKEFQANTALENEAFGYIEITKEELRKYREVARQDSPRIISPETRETIIRVSEELEQWFEDAAEGVDDVGDDMAEDDRSYFEAIAIEAWFVTGAFRDDGNFEPVCPIVR